MKTSWLFVFLLGTFLVSFTSAQPGPHDPQQVHISLGTNETEMVITWVTMKAIPGGDTALVVVGLTEHVLEDKHQAEVFRFESYFITYRALLTGLKPNTRYYYKVGSQQKFTDVYDFKTLPVGEKWLPRLALYGDLGYQNERSLPYLSQDVKDNKFDAIFHVGDFAYDLNEDNSEQGSRFMRSIEKVAARVPYLTIPGNHEYENNFSHYDARFSMLGDRHAPEHSAPLSSRINNHFWSLDMGPAHILMFSSEFYYFTQFGWDQIERQFRFLEEDLQRANANRHIRPWIIVMGHRPMYCLKIGDDSCDYATLERPDLRQGIHMHGDKSKPRQFGLEELFYKYGVDIQIYGHEHFYARLLPVYNYTLMNVTNGSNPYDNAKGPMHITTGSAGNREKHPDFNKNLRDFVGFHAYDYGYTRMTFKSVNHIHVEQVSDDRKGQVIDVMEIIKHDAHPKWMHM